MSLADEVAAEIRTVIADLGLARAQLDPALRHFERAGQGFARVGRGTTTDQLPQAVAASGEAAKLLVTTMSVVDQARELLWNYLLVITPSLAGPRPTATPATSSPAQLQKEPDAVAVPPAGAASPAVAQVDRAYAPGAQDDVRALGFDPYNGLGPLDDRFRPGVNDSVGPGYRPARGPHEIQAASTFAREGADVRLVREDHTQQDRKSIDAYVRWHRADHGTGTEFKSLVSANNVSRATKRAMLDGAAQLSQRMGRADGLARGQVLVDARQRDLTVDGALQACRSAAGQANAHAQVLPAKVIMVISDDTICVYRPQVAVDGGGGTHYARPDESSFRHVTRDDRDWNDLWRQQ